MVIPANGTFGDCSTAVACYFYNAEGQRIAKYTKGGTLITFYVYGSDGEVVADTDGNLNWNDTYIHFGGQLVAQYRGSNTAFLISDHLGSTRLDTITPYTGSQAVYDNMDYLPFGEQVAGYSATYRKFTSKERDDETNPLANGNIGLDNFGARYNSSPLGRFLSPDPDNAGASADDPQSWNAYAYVGNDPLNLVDPDGLCGGPPGSVSFTVGDTTSTTDIFSTPCIDGSSFSWRAFLQDAGNAAQKANDYLHVAYDFWVNTKPNSGCVAAATAAGAAFGASKGVELGPLAQAALAVPTAGGSEALGGPAGGALLGGLAGAGAGGGIGFMVGQVACRVGGGGGAGGGGSGTGGGGGSGKGLKYSPKIVKQMANRGWTQGEVERVVATGEQTTVVDRTAGSTPATQYLDRASGKFVVINNATGNVVQVSGPGFLPNPPAP